MKVGDGKGGKLENSSEVMDAVREMLIADGWECGTLGELIYAEKKDKRGYDVRVYVDIGVRD